MSNKSNGILLGDTPFYDLIRKFQSIHLFFEKNANELASKERFKYLDILVSSSSDLFR